ncbi:Formin-like protein [Trichinella pseudospiralis]
MTDGSKVRIEHDPSRAGQPSIGCAVVAKPQSGGLTWGPVSMGRRIGHVPWWTERSVPLGIRGSCAAFSENLARRDRPCTNEPCKALHRDRRGPAGEAATPSPSSNPAGGAGPV